MTIVNASDGRQILAPGCFGAASVFAVDGKVCQDCPAYAACKDASWATLQAIRDRVNVNDLLKRHEKARAAACPPESVATPAVPASQPKPVAKPIERTTRVVKVSFDLSGDQSTLIMKIANTKAQAMAVSLCKANLITGLRDKLHEGNNPFAEIGEWKHMRIACELLLTGGFTRAELLARLMADLGWTEGTARSQMAQAMAILQTFGIVRLDGDRFVLA
jgi:hypothetical protein